LINGFSDAIMLSDALKIGKMNLTGQGLRILFPDFSFAGYRVGGVALPENVPVKITFLLTDLSKERILIRSQILFLSRRELIQ
jgi:hypothetical protein